MWLLAQIPEKLIPTASEVSNMSRDGVFNWIIAILLAVIIGVAIAYYRGSSSNQDRLYDLLKTQNSDNHSSHEKTATALSSVVDAVKAIATTTATTGECVGEIHTQMQLQTEILRSVKNQ